MHRHQCRHSHAFREQLAHAMAGRFGRDHGNVHVRRRLNLPEVNIEAVGEHQSLTLGHVRRDFARVQIALDMIRDQDHHHIGGLRGVGGGKNLEPGRFRLGRALASFVQSNHYVHAAIAQIERVGVALAAVADDRYRLVLQ